MAKFQAWRFWERDRIPTPAQHWDRENYIPLKPQELIQRLENWISCNGGCDGQSDCAQQQANFREKSLQIREWAHQHYREQRETILASYDRYDPDTDGKLVPNPDFEVANPASDHETYRTLLESISASLQKANYRRLKPLEIQEALTAASHWGVKLRIRFTSFRHLEVYARGDVIARRMRRDWRHCYRRREFEVPIYQRLVVVFRTKDLQNLPDLIDPNCIHLRMFKNIPKADVDMMLPGSQIRLNWTDTGRIGIPTIWGLVTLASKLVKSFWLIAILSAFKILSSFVLIAAIVVASLVYGVKTILSYSTTKKRYQLSVARNLYYQNLDNNLGALLRIVEEAEQQEVCEAIVAYFVLQNCNRALDSRELDARAEALLRSITRLDIDFDVNDALRDLFSIGIAQPTDEGWCAAVFGKNERLLEQERNNR